MASPDPLLRVQYQLTDRDLILLGWLADHGVLTSPQIATALFPSLDFAQQRLRTLTQLRVVDRFRPNKPDGGTYPCHYLLAQPGVEIVCVQRGGPLPRRGQAAARRWQLTNRANLPHLLGTNGFFTDLAGYARTHPDCALTRWWPAARCQQMGAFADPDSRDVHVRTYTPRSRPDGHGIWAQADQRVPFFLEFDTGTERPLTRLVDKLDGCLELARVTGRVRPVLFSLPAALRERHLHQLPAEAGPGYPVATIARDRLDGANPAEAVWWQHRRNGGLLRLAELDVPGGDSRTA